MKPKLIVVFALLALAVGVDFASKMLSIGADALIIGIAVWIWKPWNQK